MSKLDDSSRGRRRQRGQQEPQVELFFPPKGKDSEFPRVAGAGIPLPLPTFRDVMIARTVAAKAKSNGLDDPEVRSMLGRYFPDGRKDGVNGEYVASVVRGALAAGENVWPIRVKSVREFYADIRDVRELAAAGRFLEMSAGIKANWERTPFTDEAHYVARYVERLIEGIEQPRQGPELGAKPAGWVSGMQELKATTGGITGNLLNPMGAEDASLTEDDIGFVEGQIPKIAKIIREGSSLKDEGQSIDTTWRLFDMLMPQSKGEALHRLRRIVASRKIKPPMKEQAYKDSMVEVMGEALVIDYQRTLMSWTREGPDAFLEMIGKSSSPEIMRFKFTKAEVDGMRNTVAILPDEHKVVFLRTYVGLLGFTNVANDFVREVGERAAEVGGDAEKAEGLGAFLNVREVESKLIVLIQEFDNLPMAERHLLQARRGERFHAVLKGGSSEADVEGAARIKSVLDATCMNPLWRLPSCLELLYMNDMLREFATGKGVDRLYERVMVPVSNHWTLALKLDEMRSLTRPDGVGRILGEVSAIIARNREMTAGFNFREDEKPYKMSLSIKAETGFIGDLTAAAQDMASQNPEAAMEYFRAYCPGLTEGFWSGHVLAQTGYVEVARRILDRSFREEFSRNPAYYRSIRGLEGLELGDRNMAETVSLAAVESQEHFRLFQTPGFLDSIAESVQARPDLVEEFIGCVGQNRLNKAKACRVMLMSDPMDKAHRRIVGTSRGLLRMFDDEDLAGVDWAQVDISNLAPRLEAAAKRSRERHDEEAKFTAIVGGLPPGLMQRFDSLLMAAPALKRSDRASTVKAWADAFGDAHSAAVVQMAETLARSAGADKAAAILDSRVLVERIGALTETPCARTAFAEALVERANEFATQPADTVVESVFASPPLPAIAAVESVLDWTGVDAPDRRGVVDLVLSRLGGGNPAMLALSARELRENPELLDDLKVITESFPGLIQTLGRGQAVVKEGDKVYVHRDSEAESG